MPTTQTKGITVKIDAELHAEIKAYLEQNEMTMSEFIALAVQDELHPKIQEMEAHNMAERTRTLAFPVPESLFQRIKDYIKKHLAPWAGSRLAEIEVQDNLLTGKLLL